MKSLGTLALGLLVAFLGVVVVTGLLYANGDFLTWTLTPLAFTICAALLFTAAVLVVVREPHSRLVPVACAAALLAFPAVLSLDAPLEFSALPLLVLSCGVAALVVASLLGARRRGVRLSQARIAVGSVAVIVILGGSVLLGLGQLYGVNAVHEGPPSPDGTWQLLGYESNMGATDEGVAEVVVRRDVYGLLRQRRSLYSGYQWGPSMGWVDSATVLLDGRPLDIYHDAAVGAVQ